MAIKSDVWIKRMCKEHGLIEPFAEKLIRRIDDRRIISYGLSSYGYDCRLARDEFKVFSPVTGTEVDPKNFDPNNLLDVPLRQATDGSRRARLRALEAALRHPGTCCRDPPISLVWSVRLAGSRGQAPG